MTLQQLTNTESNLNLSNETDKKKFELLGLDPMKDKLSQAEKNYSVYALDIFSQRYLLKSKDGKIVERLDDLFRRVAMVGLMNVLYNKRWYNKDADSSIKLDSFYITLVKDYFKSVQNDIKDLDYKDYLTSIHAMKWGDDFIINPYHKEMLISRYIELVEEGKINKPISDIFKALQEPEFTSYYSPVDYYEAMVNQKFLPNTPALMNAGTKLNMNAACFTLRMKDDLDEIYKTNWDVAKVFKAGGGIGINYSELRPEGAYVTGTGGKSSGTLSWLKQTDETTGRVAQGGKRRGASMGILNMNHPEIDRFIDMKNDNKTLPNHNISVCAPNSFFEDFFTGHETEVKRMAAIAKNAWISGDPGMVFLDNMNSNNLLEPVLESKIDVTNPCSEISMYPYESCILASINLTKLVRDDKSCVDGGSMYGICALVTRFLDNLIDATKYPIPEINEMTKKCRRIGLGFMGLADTMIMLGIKYNSKEGMGFIHDTAYYMTKTAMGTSCELARERGAFPLWYDPKYPKEHLPVNQLLKDGMKIDKHDGLFDYGLRNCSVTTVAPTGTIAMMVDVSSGIEPIFSRDFTKNVTVGDFNYDNEGLKDSEVMVTAMEMHPFDHIMAQARAQEWITNGISKTINLPHDASAKLIEYCYVLSWALGNKGISVYRDGSKPTQVLNDKKKSSMDDIQPISDFTISKIQNLKNIPKKYIEEMLSGKFDKHIPQIAVGKPYFKPVTEELVFTMELTCPNCNHGNHLIKTGRGDMCFTCSRCGSQLGSCT